LLIDNKVWFDAATYHENSLIPRAAAFSVARRWPGIFLMCVTSRVERW